MSAIEHLLPWTQQPQGAVCINPVWARDCLALVSGAAPINVVNGEVGVTSGVATRYAPGVAGLARTARRGAYGDGREVYKIPPWVGDFTIVWVGGMAGFSGNDCRAAGVANSGLSAPRIMVGENGSRTACTTVPSGGSTVYVSEVSQTAGGSRAYIGRLAGTGLSFWQDGVLQETKTQATNYWAGCDRFFVGGVGWNQTADADVYLAGIWARALSDDEIVTLSANPWQLFEPRRVPVSAGGGGTTINAGVGESTADGSTADISLGTTVNAGVGSAVADGSAASVSRGTTVNASIGAAVAAGLDADIGTSAGEYQVGNAVADGATASISLGTTVSADVSNAVAAGSTADVSLGTTVAAGVGNAVADGLSATITAGQTVSATVGDAVADGKTATITNDPASTGIDLSFYGWDIFPEKLPEEKDSVRKYILDAVRDLSSKPIQKEVAKRATARILPPPVFVPRNLMVREIRLAVAEIVEAANEERRRKVRKYNETIMLWM